MVSLKGPVLHHCGSCPQLKARGAGEAGGGEKIKAKSGSIADPLEGGGKGVNYMGIRKAGPSFQRYSGEGGEKKLKLVATLTL